jgi:hypothetical protein
MFETVTYRIDKLHKLKRAEDLLFCGVFILLGGYKKIQKIFRWTDPFYGVVVRSVASPSDTDKY